MNKIEIKISANLENECVIRNAIASFAATINPTVDEIIDIKTIISEAVSNAITHGYEHDKTQDVYVKASLEENNLEIVIQDFGKGIENIDEVLKPKSVNALNQERAGIGFTIIKTLSDDFKIISKKNVGTKLIISKVLSSTGVRS